MKEEITQRHEQMRASKRLTPDLLDSMQGTVVTVIEDGFIKETARVPNGWRVGDESPLTGLELDDEARKALASL